MKIILTSLVLFLSFASNASQNYLVCVVMGEEEETAFLIDSSAQKLLMAGFYDEANATAVAMELRTINFVSARCPDTYAIKAELDIEDLQIVYELNTQKCSNGASTLTVTDSGVTETATVKCARKNLSVETLNIPL